MKNAFIVAVLITVVGCMHTAPCDAAERSAIQGPLLENGIIFDVNRVAVDEKALHVILMGIRNST